MSPSWVSEIGESMKNQKPDFELDRHKYIENDQKTGKAQLTKEGRVYLRWRRVYLRWRRYCRKYQERFGQCAPEKMQRDLWKKAEQELAAE